MCYTNIHVLLLLYDYYTVGVMMQTSAGTNDHQTAQVGDR